MDLDANKIIERLMEKIKLLTYELVLKEEMIECLEERLESPEELYANSK